MKRRVLSFVIRRVTSWIGFRVQERSTKPHERIHSETLPYRTGGVIAGFATVFTEGEAFGGGGGSSFSTGGEDFGTGDSRGWLVFRFPLAPKSPLTIVEGTSAARFALAFGVTPGLATVTG